MLCRPACGSLSISLQNIPIAWANQAVFDYACNLNTGICELYMWPVHEELCDSLNYMGTTVLNSATHDTVCLKVEISTPGGVPEGHPPIMFPSREMVHHVNDSVSQRRPNSVRCVHTHSPASHSNCVLLYEEEQWAPHQHTCPTTHGYACTVCPVCMQRETSNKKKIKELEMVVNRDPLAELDDQDKQLVWYMRWVD